MHRLAFVVSSGLIPVCRYWEDLNRTWSKGFTDDSAAYSYISQGTQGMVDSLQNDFAARQLTSFPTTSGPNRRDNGHIIQEHGCIEAVDTIEFAETAPQAHSQSTTIESISTGWILKTAAKTSGCPANVW